MDLSDTAVRRELVTLARRSLA